MEIDALRPPVEDGPWEPPRFLPPIDGPGLSVGRSWIGCTYSALDGFRPLVLDVHLPVGPVGRWPAVLWIHGGGLHTGDRRYQPLQWRQTELFRYLLEAGLAVVTADYRLLSEAPLPGALRDCRAALRYVRHFSRELGIDPNRIGVWGESAGGLLAALVGLHGSSEHAADLLGDAGCEPVADMSVRAVVDWYGPSDLSEWARDEPAAFEGPQWVDVCSPVRRVHPGAPPFLLVHGDRDGMVPLEASVRLHEALQRVDATSTLRVVEDAEHCFIGQDLSPLIRHAVDFLVAALRIPIGPGEYAAVTRKRLGFLAGQTTAPEDVDRMDRDEICDLFEGA